MKKNILKHQEYIFYMIKQGKVLYVGESQNIKERLKNLFSMYYKTTKVLNERIYGVEMFEIGDSENSIDRKIFELYKVKELKPIANRKRKWILDLILVCYSFFVYYIL